MDDNENNQSLIWEEINILGGVDEDFGIAEASIPPDRDSALKFLKKKDIILEIAPKNEPSKIDLIDINCFKSINKTEFLIKHTSQTKSILQTPYQIPDSKWKETARKIK